jgi:hypothetical protein
MKSTDADALADYASPNGIPDKHVDEREARLWLLSQAERQAGHHVRFNDETQRWERVGIPTPASTRLTCQLTSCGRSFLASRTDAKFCSSRCRQRSYNKRYSGPVRPSAVSAAQS